MPPLKPLQLLELLKAIYEEEEESEEEKELKRGKNSEELEIFQEKEEEMEDSEEGGETIELIFIMQEILTGLVRNPSTPRQLKRNHSSTIADVRNNDDNNSNSHYDIALEIRHRKILKYKAEIAKMEAKAISSVTYQNQRVSITEFQKSITIGHGKTCNLRINKPLYIANTHCTISIRKTNIKDLSFESFIKNGSNKRTFINKKLLEPHEERFLHHNDKILVKTQEGFIEMQFFEDAKINLENQLKDVAKMEAKAISSIVFENGILEKERHLPDLVK
ncbi:7269_t:CDS:2 [Entrophospora sp. SA101]|nr:7269_t:CDS:2 [Entrophospora sp. SA101]